MIVIDASLMIAWLFDRDLEAMQPRLGAWLAEAPIIVPSHWPIALADALRRGVRDERLTRGDLAMIVERIERLDVRVQPPLATAEIGALAEFAAGCDLTAGEAAYVQLAIEHRAALATFDRALRQAAARLHIALLPP